MNLTDAIYKYIYLQRLDQPNAANANISFRNIGKKYRILINKADMQMGNIQYPNTHILWNNSLCYEYIYTY